MKKLILTIAVLGAGAIAAPALAAGGGGEEGGVAKLGQITVSLNTGEDDPCGQKLLNLKLAVTGEAAEKTKDKAPFVIDGINQHLSGLSLAETKEKGFAKELKAELLDVINHAIEPDHIDEVLIQSILVQ